MAEQKKGKTTTRVYQEAPVEEIVEEEEEVTVTTVGGVEVGPAKSVKKRKVIRKVLVNGKWVDQEVTVEDDGKEGSFTSLKETCILNTCLF